MDTLWHDLKYAARRLTTSIAFTSIVLLTLAIGIGATTAIFSVVHAVLLAPLPYPESDRLVMVWRDFTKRDGPAKEWFSPPSFFDWRERVRSFDGMAAISGWSPNLTGAGEPVRLNAATVSADYFELLGVRPQQGRWFFRSDETVESGRVVILSHALWQRQFNADTHLVGEAISLNGEPYTVVGIMPPDFRPALEQDELWRPLINDAGASCGRGCINQLAVARLSPEVTIERATSEAAAVAAALGEEYPDTDGRITASLEPLKESLTGDVRTPLLALLGAVGFVLLIACVNVANLLLARATGRDREVAIRTALGAGRRRIVRQLLTESLLLAVIGGGLGVLLAYWAVDGLVALMPAGFADRYEFGLNTPVLLFALAVTLGAGLLFGLAPALQSSRPDLTGSLKEGGRGGSATGRARRLRSALVVSEMAITLMVLVGAALMMRSFVGLKQIDLGFEPRNALVASVFLPPDVYEAPPQVLDFYGRLLERLEEHPQVQAAGAVSSLPIGGNVTDITIGIEGRPAPSPGQDAASRYTIVSGDALRAMGTSLVAGRELTADDREGAPLVLMVNRSFADRHWPGEDPVGRRLKIGSLDAETPWRTVVGVVEDVRVSAPGLPPVPMLYRPHGQATARAMSLVVRTRGEPVALGPIVRQEVRALDPNLPISGLMTMEEMVGSSLSPARLYMTLFGVFALVALTLAAIGIYGVTAYAVGQRTHEIGIRMALGAGQTDVVRLVLAQGGRLVLAGVVIGGLLAFALTRTLSSMLYGVNPRDPLTFLAVALLLAAVALIASYLPARRAARVHPTVALRTE